MVTVMGRSILAPLPFLVVPLRLGLVLQTGDTDVASPGALPLPVRCHAGRVFLVASPAMAERGLRIASRVLALSYLFLARLASPCSCCSGLLLITANHTAACSRLQIRFMAFRRSWWKPSGTHSLPEGKVSTLSFHLIVGWCSRSHGNPKMASCCIPVTTHASTDTV